MIEGSIVMTDGVGPGGKGDKQRPTDRKKWDEGWERIYGNKDKNTNTNDHDEWMHDNAIDGE